MRYTLAVQSCSPSKAEHVAQAVEKGMKRRYNPDLAEAMQEFLKKCIGDAHAITKVTLDSAGRFIVETLRPLTEFILVIENMLRSQFHQNIKVECTPL